MWLKNYSGMSKKQNCGKPKSWQGKGSDVGQLEKSTVWHCEYLTAAKAAEMIGNWSRCDYYQGETKSESQPENLNTANRT